MTPLTHISSMDHFLEAMESLDTAKTSPFGYSFGDVVFFERMLADRAVTSATPCFSPGRCRRSATDWRNTCPPAAVRPRTFTGCKL